MKWTNPILGARRVRGKRGRGAYGKTIVFGLLKRDGRVYTEIVPDCTKATLQAVIRGRIAPETVIHSDGWRGYDGLVDIGFDKHFRVNHSANEFAKGSNISMALSHSGATLNAGCKSLTGCPTTPSICTSKKPNFALISVVLICTLNYSDY